LVDSLVILFIDIDRMINTVSRPFLIAVELKKFETNYCFFAVTTEFGSQVDNRTIYIETVLTICKKLLEHKEANRINLTIKDYNGLRLVAGVTV
jgi:hypothetical protein